MIFEFIPRFSGAVVFSYKLGFSDVLWSFQEQILGMKADQLMHPVGSELDEMID
jgi:hypothetical protein